MKKMTPDILWQALASEMIGHRLQGLLIRRIRPEAQCSLFLGLEEPGNHRLLILQVNSAALPDHTVLPEARAIEVRITTLPGGEDGQGALLLVLKEDRFADVFEVLVCDLAEALAHAVTDYEAVTLFLSRLMKWHRFLEVSQGDGLGDEAQQGLYGELWFLRNQLLPISGLQGICYWTGYARTPQDFTCPNGAVEVKTTLRGGHGVLQIHGTEQLDETSVPLLLLCHLTLKAGSGETLKDIVGSIRGIIRDHPVYRERFEVALLEAGYHDRHAALYSTTDYRMHDLTLFEVKDHFPRIRSCDVRGGVETLNYSITTAACLGYTFPLSNVGALLTG